MKLVIKEVKLNNEEKIFQRIFGDGTMTYAHTRLHAYCSSYVPSQDKHPLATSHWEVAAMAAHKGDLCRDIENYLRKK